MISFSIEQKLCNQFHIEFHKHFHNQFQNMKTIQNKKYKKNIKTIKNKKHKNINEKKNRIK